MSESEEQSLGKTLGKGIKKATETDAEPKEEKQEKRKEQATVKSLGRTIKKTVDIDGKYLDTSLERSFESVFMNRDRRKIFEYLCRKPCAHLRQIARDIGLSPPSAKWHLERIKERGFIYSAEIGGHLVFYPRRLILKESLGFFSYLSREKTGDILKLIILKPGITQRELADELGRNPQSVNKLLSKIKKEDLVHHIKDGRQKKNFIAKRTIEKVGKTPRNRKQHFITWLLEELRNDGVRPEIMTKKKSQVTIKIFDGEKDVPFIIVTQPLEYLLK